MGLVLQFQVSIGILTISPRDKGEILHEFLCTVQVHEVRILPLMCVVFTSYMMPILDS